MSYINLHFTYLLTIPKTMTSHEERREVKYFEIIYYSILSGLAN